MRITYIRLENVAGLYIGGNRESIEISFDNSKNKIVAIDGSNGKGKTTLLSSLHPFANVTSLDDRSTVSYILQKKDGYKEIHFKNKNDEYVIKHYFKATKDTHTLKSYFMKNGEELNENGNVTSFNSLVEIHLGLTQEMMRLIRIGSNVNSFITLAPAKRKEYIGKLIEDINLYINIYKKLNDDMKVVKVLLQTNSTNLYNCHISDIIVEEDKLSQLNKSINEYEKDRDKLISQLGKIDSLIKGNDIDELKRKEADAESSLREFKITEELIVKNNLEDRSIEDLIKQRSALSDKKISIQSSINSYRISIDTSLHNIERLEIMIKKVTSDNDIQSLTLMIHELRNYINDTSNTVKNFIPTNTDSNDVYDILSKLNSFNKISQMIYTFGNKPIDVYLKLRNDGKSVDKWLKEQARRRLNNLNNSDIISLINKVFQDDQIITPNCDTEYVDCPYYRLNEVISDIKDKVDEENFDDETLRYIQIISNNIDNILNDLDRIIHIQIPDAIKTNLTEHTILNRLKDRLSIFDTTDIHNYLSLLKEYEIYKDKCNKLKEYEYQLSIYKKSGIDNHINEINSIKNDIDSFNKNISDLQKEILSVNKELEITDRNITLVTKFNDGKKYKKILESTIESTKKILEPLETATAERVELNFKLQNISNAINASREQYHSLETKIFEYKRLLKESTKLSTIKNELSILIESVGTKKGIPVVYMNKYLKKIRKVSNTLLDIIYDGELSLAKFNVTPEVFEVPYIKNGKKIPDIKYASQSELAMSTMALSFALASNASDNYNILLLDETDSGLDETRRIGFIKMLYNQMTEINAEQVFIISQNLSQMSNVPMDSIRLSDVGTKSKLQNIIFE